MAAAPRAPGTGRGSARTFAACDGERVACYYSLTVGQIDTLEAPERIRRDMGQYPIPLIILARLAVDLNYQKRGLGFSLLQAAITRAIAVAEHAGIRALLTHPIGRGRCVLPSVRVRAGAARWAPAAAPAQGCVVGFRFVVIGRGRQDLEDGLVRDPV